MCRSLANNDLILLEQTVFEGMADTLTNLYVFITNRIMYHTQPAYHKIVSQHKTNKTDHDIYLF